MGTSSSKPLDIRCHRKSRKGSFNLFLDTTSPPLPPPPPSSQVRQQLLLILSKIDINSKQRDQLLKLSSALQWRLICRHNDFLRKNKASLESVGKSEASILVHKLKKEPSLLSLQALRRWITNVVNTPEKNNEFRSFILLGGLTLLIEILKVTAICARATHSYSKQLELLKILEVIVRNEGGAEELIKVPGAPQTITMNLHPYHVDLTCTTLEVLSSFIWLANGVGIVLDSLKGLRKEGEVGVEDDFKKMKSEEESKKEVVVGENGEKISVKGLNNQVGWGHRFYPFVTILKRGRNIVMIQQILAFLNSLVAASVEERSRMVVMGELVAVGIREECEVLRVKVANGYFRIDDCTFEIIQGLMKKDWNDFDTDRTESRKKKLLFSGY